MNLFFNHLCVNLVINKWDLIKLDMFALN